MDDELQPGSEAPSLGVMMKPEMVHVDDEKHSVARGVPAELRVDFIAQELGRWTAKRPNSRNRTMDELWDAVSKLDWDFE